MTEHQTPAAGSAGSDVVTLLIEQHEEIRRLFQLVVSTTGEDRKDAFHRLVRLLAVHETAEEEIVHPYAKRHIAGGEATVEQRLDEERHAKQLLSDLERMDPDDAAFMAKLERLRARVEEHAGNEERLEFTYLQAVTDPEERHRMASAVRAAEAVAPTHPHPGVEGVAGNVALGPLTAVMDRARDAIRHSRR